MGWVGELRFTGVSGLNRPHPRPKYRRMQHLSHGLLPAPHCHIQPHKLMSLVIPFYLGNRTHIILGAHARRCKKCDAAGDVYPRREDEAFAQHEIRLPQDEAGMQQRRRAFAIQWQVIARVIAPNEIFFACGRPGEGGEGLVETKRGKGGRGGGGRGWGALLRLGWGNRGASGR